MNVLLWVLAALVLIPLVVLAFPVRMKGSIQIAERIEIRGAAGLLGDLIGIYGHGGPAEGLSGEFRFLKWKKPFGGGTETGNEVERSEGQSTEKTRSGDEKTKKDGKSAFRLFKQERVRKIGLRMIKAMLAAIRVNGQVSGVYAFEDPAMTGWIAGGVAVAAVWAPWLQIHPDFVGEETTITGELQLWLIPLQLGAIALFYGIQLAPSLLREGRR